MPDPQGALEFGPPQGEPEYWPPPRDDMALDGAGTESGPAEDAEARPPEDREDEAAAPTDSREDDGAGSRPGVAI